MFNRECPCCNQKTAEIKFSTLFSGETQCTNCQEVLSLRLFIIPLSLLVYSIEVQFIIFIFLMVAFGIYIDWLTAIILTITIISSILIFFSLVLPLKQKEESKVGLVLAYIFTFLVLISTIYFLFFEEQKPKKVEKFPELKKYLIK